MPDQVRADSQSCHRISWRWIATFDRGCWSFASNVQVRRSPLHARPLEHTVVRKTMSRPGVPSERLSSLPKVSGLTPGARY